MSFEDFFSDTTLASLESYVKRFGRGIKAFREKIIWTDNVSEVLQANNRLIMQIYENYKIGGKFTLQSAFKLIKDLDIDMTIEG